MDQKEINSFEPLHRLQELKEKIKFKAERKKYHLD